MENSQINHSLLFSNPDLAGNPVIAESTSAEETFALGKSFSLLLEKGVIVALNGPLGAGKTCFVKGIAQGLGIREVITSPTYTIISGYEANIGKEIKISFFHIDAYRLNGIEDFFAIGGDEIIYGDGISVIEWADKFSGINHPDLYKVDIKITGENNRLIRIQKTEYI